MQPAADISLPRPRTAVRTAELGSFAVRLRVCPVFAMATGASSAVAARANDDLPKVVLSWDHEATEMPEAPYLNVAGTERGIRHRG